MARGRHPHAFARAGGQAVAAAMRAQRAQEIVDALKAARLDASEQTVLTIAAVLRVPYAEAAEYVRARGLDVYA